MFSMRNFQYTDFLTSAIFHAYASAHNKLESVGPTFSSLESKMAPSNEGEDGGNAIIPDEKSTKMIKIEGNHSAISAKKLFGKQYI